MGSEVTLFVGITESNDGNRIEGVADGREIGCLLVVGPADRLLEKM